MLKKIMLFLILTLPNAAYCLFKEAEEKLNHSSVKVEFSQAVFFGQLDKLKIIVEDISPDVGKYLTENEIVNALKLATMKRDKIIIGYLISTIGSKIINNNLADENLTLLQYAIFWSSQTDEDEPDLDLLKLFLDSNADIYKEGYKRLNAFGYIDDRIETIKIDIQYNCTASQIPGKQRYIHKYNSIYNFLKEYEERLNLDMLRSDSR